MRYIVIPQPVSVSGVTLPNGEPITATFEDLIGKTLITSPKAVDNIERLKHFRLILEAVEKLKPGEVLELENKQWEYLESLLTEFRDFNPIWKRAFLPFFEAILGADTKAPVSPPAESST